MLLSSKRFWRNVETCTVHLERLLRYAAICPKRVGYGSEKALEFATCQCHGQVMQPGRLCAYLVATARGPSRAITSCHRDLYPWDTVLVYLVTDPTERHRGSKVDKWPEAWHVPQ